MVLESFPGDIPFLFLEHVPYPADESIVESYDPDAQRSVEAGS